MGIVISHVDDFEYAGTEEWKKEVMGKLKNIFQLSKESKNNFRFIGVEIKQNEAGVFVNQDKYCGDLKEI